MANCSECGKKINFFNGAGDGRCVDCSAKLQQELRYQRRLEKNAETGLTNDTPQKPEGDKAFLSQTSDRKISPNTAAATTTYWVAWIVSALSVVSFFGWLIAGEAFIAFALLLGCLGSALMLFLFAEIGHNVAKLVSLADEKE